VTYGFGIVVSAYGHDGAAAREPPALEAMRIIAGCAMIRIAANDLHGGGSRTAAPHGAPLPETIRHTRELRLSMESGYLYNYISVCYNPVHCLVGQGSTGSPRGV
jgi:hypothetical protein